MFVTAKKRCENDGLKLKRSSGLVCRSLTTDLEITVNIEA